MCSKWEHMEPRATMKLCNSTHRVFEQTPPTKGIMQILIHILIVYNVNLAKWVPVLAFCCLDGIE